MSKIGYWKSEYEPHLPSPIISDTIYPDEFIEKCKEWAKTRISIYDKRRVGYLGYSDCRICGKLNGSVEYTYNGFTFPEGIFHYIIDHNIEIDEQFMQMIKETPVIQNVLTPKDEAQEFSKRLERNIQNVRAHMSQFTYL